MITILIAILHYLGVMATPELLNDEAFNRDNQARISQATVIYQTNHYYEKDGVIVVDDINP